MKDSLAEGLSQRLQLVIDEKKWKKVQLAKAGDITPKTLSAYFAETAVPNAKTLINWAVELNVSIDWLLLGRGEMFYSQNENQEKDPMIRRMREAKEILKDAPPEILYDVIKNITQGDTGKAESRQNQKKAS